MRRLYVIPLIFLLLSFTWSEPLTPLPALSIGDKAPDVELPDLNGSTLKLSSLQGNVVLINFWSTWCVACNTIKNPEYARLWEEYKDYTFKDAKGFVIYSVAFDSDKQKWAKRIFEAGLNWPTHVIDQDSYYSSYWWIYNMRSIPSSFLLDANGRIMGINMDYGQLDRKLTELKRDKKSETVATTPPPPHSGTVSPPANDHASNNVPPPPPVKPKNDAKTPTLPPANDQANSTPANPKKEENQPATAPKSDVPAINVYKIQLGVVKSPNLANYKQLNDLGAVEIEKASSSMMRILLGTYDKEYVATSMLTTAKERGFKDAFIVKRTAAAKPAPPATAPPPPPANTTKPTATPPPPPAEKPKLVQVFKIQLGVFAKADLSRFSTISNLGSANIEKTDNGMDRVLFGSFTDRPKGETALAEVRAKGYPSAFIVLREENASALEMMSLKDQMPDLAKSMLDKQAPEIVLKSAENIMLPLSGQHGKTVLLYLWASWSGEARDNVADLNELYNKYKGDNFELYSVAFDKKTDIWKDVCKEDQVSWKLNVIDTKGTDSELLKQYGVRYLPALFLLDENGKVVGENLLYDKLDSELKSRVLK